MDPKAAGETPKARPSSRARQRRTVAGHLSAHEAVSYIDRIVSSGTLACLERHLSLCQPCRREVIEVSLFLRSRAEHAARKEVPRA